MSGVASIGDGAFYNCSSLKNVYYYGISPYIDEIILNPLTTATCYYDTDDKNIFELKI